CAASNIPCQQISLCTELFSTESFMPRYGLAFCLVVLALVACGAPAPTPVTISDANVAAALTTPPNIPPTDIPIAAPTILNTIAPPAPTNSPTMTAAPTQAGSSTPQPFATFTKTPTSSLLLTSTVTATVSLTTTATITFTT